MAQLDQASLNQIVAAVMQVLGNQGAAFPKPAPQFKNSFGTFNPIQKDRQLLAAFKRKGFTDVVLMDRSDRTKPFNVKPYGSVEKGTGWLAEGRVVRRGEKGVKGLFHISQTDPVPAKPEMTPERRGMFKKAKAKLQPVKA
jgi:hypothetical protein